jgi:REP element-mobilizing transposase RayT
MGYPPRDELPGCFYHVCTRGNNRRPIYVDDASYALFLLRLGIVVQRYGWTMAAYCLLPNHYHLVIKLGDLGMSDGMKELNGGYARAFNMRNGRRDHLFGRRFWSRVLVDDDDLLETCRYVELNPSRGTSPCHPREHRWSSYRASVGLTAPQPWHSPSLIWELFDARPRVAMDLYARFVGEGLIGTGLESARPVSDTGVNV